MAEIDIRSALFDPEQPAPEQPPVTEARVIDIRGALFDDAPEQPQQEFFDTGFAPPQEAFDIAGQYLQRKKTLVAESYETTKQTVIAHNEIGQLFLIGDPEAIAKSEQLLSKIPQRTVVPETPLEKGIAATVGVPASLLNRGRLDNAAAGIAESVTENAEQAQTEWINTPEMLANPLARAAFGSTIGFDTAVGAGGILADLIRFKDPETGQGLNYNLMRNIALSGGAVDASLQYVGIGAMGKLGGMVFKDAATVATNEAFNLLGKGFGLKVLDSALALGRQATPILAPQVGIIASDLLHEKVAMEVHNYLSDVGVEPPEADYFATQLKDRSEAALYASLGVTLGTRLVAKSLGRAVNVGEDTMYAREAAAKDQALALTTETPYVAARREYLTPRNWTAEKGAANPPTVEVAETITPMADLYRDKVVAQIWDAPDDAAVALILKDELLNRGGEKTGFTTADHQAKRGEIAQLQRELDGVTATLDPEGRTPVVTATGLKDKVRELNTKDAELRAQKVKTKDPVRAAVREELKATRALVEEKKTALAEAQHQEKMMSEGRVWPSEEALIRKDIALEKAETEGRRGWIEGEEMTKESLDSFHQAIIDARREAKKARTAGTAEGRAKGMAEVRQKVDNAARRMALTAERNKVKSEINGIVRTGAKKSGVVTAEANTIFRNFREVMNLSQEEAQAALTKGEFPPGIDGPVLKGLLKLKIDSKGMTLTELQGLRDSFKDMFENGNFERFEQLQARQMELVGIKQAVVKELGGENWSDVLADARRNEFRDATLAQRGSFNKMIRNHMASPGWGAIGNWKTTGAILHNDPYAYFADSTLGKLFETIDQEKTAELGKAADMGEMYRIISEAYGIPEDGKRNFAINSFIFDNMMDDANGSVITNRAGEPVLNEKGEEVRMSRFQRIARSSVLYQPDAVHRMKVDFGYTDELIAAIHDLPDEDLRFQKLMLADFNRMWKKVNAVYSRKNGFDLPAVEMYFPRERDIVSTDSPLNLMLQDAALTQADAQHSGRLKEQTVSKLPFREQNALETWQRYIKDMNHYVAWADKMEELNTVLRDPDTLDLIRARFGNDVGKDIISSMQDQLDVMGRGYAEYKTEQSVGDWVWSNMVRAQMGGKMVLAGVQVGAALLYGEKVGLGPKEFLAGAREFLMDVPGAMKAMDERAPYLALRGTGVDPYLQNAITKKMPIIGDQNGRIRFIMDMAADKLLSPIVMGDKFAVKMGGYILYRHLLKTGLQPEQAMRQVELHTRDTQQSGALSTQSKWQQSNFLPLKIMSAYKTASYSMLRKTGEATYDVVRGIEEKNKRKAEWQEKKTDETRAEYDKAKSRLWEVSKRAAKIFLLYHVGSSLAYQMTKDFGQSSWEDIASSVIVGQFGAIPVFGDVLTATVRRALGAKVFDSSTPFTQPLAAIGYGTADVLMWANEDGGPDWAKATKGAATAAQLVSPLPFKQAEAFTRSLVDSLDDGDITKSMYILLGGAEGTIENFREEE